MSIASLAIMSSMAMAFVVPKANKRAEICAEGLSAFTETIHPVMTKHCALCHGDTGAYLRFAASDPALAYARISPMINFSRVADSHFVRRGGRMVPGITEADLTALVTAWWEQGEKNCMQRVPYQSLPLKLPADLPSPREGFRSLRWPLAHLGPDFAKVFFEVDAQKYVNATSEVPGAYLFIRPRLLTADSSFHIQDVQVAINGTYLAPSSSFRQVDAMVAPAPIQPAGMPNPHPILSGRGLIVVEERAGADEISFGFSRLEKIAAPDCRAMERFRTDVLPLMQDRDCYFCHGGGANQSEGTDPARQRLSMAKPDGELCRDFRQRLTLSSLNLSPLVVLPDAGTGGHPPVAVAPGEFSRSWMPWMKEETAPQ